MKKIVFATVLFFGLIAVSLNSSAQQKPFSPYSPETMDAIDATPEQRATMKTMLDGYKPKFKALKDSLNQELLSKEEYETQRRQLSAQSNKDYLKIWTPEQLQKLKDLRTGGKKK